MRGLSLLAAIPGVVLHCVAHAQTPYTNSACEFTVTFPDVRLTRDDQFTARTDLDAVPFLMAKCWRCSQSCRLRGDLEKTVLAGLIDEFDLKDYVLTREPTPGEGFFISGITTKGSSIRRIETRVLLGDTSILALSTAQRETLDKTIAREFLQSARRRANAP